MERDDVRTGADLRPGMRVEVATRFSGDWAAGFEVESVADDGCRIRRMSDGSVLPVDFAYPRVRSVSFPDSRGFREVVERV